MLSEIGESITLNEEKRTYFFPKNEKVELQNVKSLVVKASGTHCIKTEDNKLHIIPVGWIHIEVESAREWIV